MFGFMCPPVDAQLRGAGEGQFDGFEGGFDAIIVEVDWDSPAFSGRSRRQTGFRPGIRFRAFLL